MLIGADLNRLFGMAESAASHKKRPGVVARPVNREVENNGDTAVIGRHL